MRLEEVRGVGDFATIAVNPAIVAKWMSAKLLFYLNKYV